MNYQICKLRKCHTANFFDMKHKKALIAANFIGFFHFLWDDIDMLNEMGYEVYAMGDNEKNEQHTLKMMADKGVTFIDAKIDAKSPLTRNNLDYYKKVKALLEKHHFDLVHCHTPIVGLFVRLAARKYRKRGTKVIYTTHGLAYTHLSSRKEYFVYHSIESLASWFCDAIITINMEDYESAKRLHCKSVFHINGVGVDTKRFGSADIDRDEYRKQLGVPKNKLMVLAIGELSRRKNHTVIVEALAKLDNKADFVFAICGREMTAGGTGDEIRRMSREYGVDTLFLGFRSDIPEVIKCADIGVMPSVREGLGLSGIEMLSEGVPLVGSDVQGIREYVIGDKTGYLCNPNDADAFAEGLRRLADAETRNRMRPHCKDIVKQFDIAVSVKQRREIYNKVLK